MNEQDRLLAERHAERERIANERNDREVPSTYAPIQRERTESKECTITWWKYPEQSPQFQITATASYPTGEKRYVVLSLIGLADLYYQISEVLQKQGVIP